MTPFMKAISSIYKIKIKIKAKLTIEFCQGVVYCSEYIYRIHFTNFNFIVIFISFYICLKKTLNIDSYRILFIIMTTSNQG